MIGRMLLSLKKREIIQFFLSSGERRQGLNGGKGLIGAVEEGIKEELKEGKIFNKNVSRELGGEERREA